MAALLYFAPLYLEGLAKNWEILIFITGLILLGVEIFVIPGFGIAGFSGIALIIIGLTLSMIDNTNFQISSPKGLQEVMKALFIVVTSIAIAFGLSIYMSKKIFAGNTFGELALKTVQNTNEGYIGIDAELQNLVGKSGYAHTILRPSGKIRVQEEIYDATSLIGYIEKGERVKIVKFQAGQLYVVREEPEA
jgi:membrane-bound serine protease (ClpP class)